MQRNSTGFKMSSLNTERLVYFLNLAFVITIFLISSDNLGHKDAKAAVVKGGWFILAVYFLMISILFYRSNFLRIKRANVRFKIVTLLPGFYIIPVIVICLMHYKQLFDHVNYLYCLGGLIWATGILWNLLKKNNHATNSSIF